MPLAWAHAEYIRLLRSIKDKKIFDLPPQVHDRYVRHPVTSTTRSWRFDRQLTSIPTGKLLRISVFAPAIIRFTTDHWRTFHELPTQDSHLGIHFADLPTTKLNSGDGVTFTFRWLPQERWEGKDFVVAIRADDDPKKR
jgi:glucoamylase